MRDKISEINFFLNSTEGAYERNIAIDLMRKLIDTSFFLAFELMW